MYGGHELASETNQVLQLLHDDAADDGEPYWDNVLSVTLSAVTSGIKDEHVNRSEWGEPEGWTHLTFSILFGEFAWKSDWTLGRLFA